MGKCYFIGCLCGSILFFHQKVLAQDTAAHKIKDSALIKASNYPGNTTIDSVEIEKELRDLLGYRKSHFLAGLDYLNNNVYFGRKDTVLTPYITTSLGYYHSSGLFINASASYLASSGQGRIDLVAIEAGYGFIAGEFQGQVTANKFFYSSQSNVVDADLKESLSFFGGYDLGFIKPTLSPTLSMSKKLDFSMGLGVEHTFYADKRAFDITPDFSVNGSTQNYYNSYYKDRKYTPKRKKAANPIQLYSISGVVLNASQFKILDYEFSLPVNYTVKKFTFNLTPFYTIPVNPAVVSWTTKILSQSPKITTGTEQIENSFFWQAGVTYKF